ncbi:hypothetical protein BTA51_25715 [Hahella sp. CCB-MM4]|uniref:STAS domain-containing protein n=1 Tax=Hahella sp. (strain CCB-MM4) TaxID=1926491 RepID=UPI000B9C6B01|nr:STAS domain-containing protein [Hahella sp. CCB-MM4]OZG70534.1 hypothetical protein BTA51_25715 [Hahella sp. CCB-MM4]
MPDYQVSWDADASSHEGGRLSLSGHIDFDNCVDVMHEGECYLSNGARSEKKVSIDVSGVENAHSVLLSVLLRWIAFTEKNHIEVGVTGLSGKMFEVARVSGIDTVLPIQ